MLISKVQESKFGRAKRIRSKMMIRRRKMRNRNKRKRKTNKAKRMNNSLLRMILKLLINRHPYKIWKISTHLSSKRTNFPLMELRDTMYWMITKISKTKSMMTIKVNWLLSNAS